MRRRRRGVGGGWDWWLIGLFGFWTVLAVVDRDGGRALPPAIFCVGFAVQALVRKVGRPGAASAVVVVTIASVAVVSVVQRSWVMAVAMGVGLLAMAGIGVSGLLSRKDRGTVDDVSSR